MRRRGRCDPRYDSNGMTETGWRPRGHRYDRRRGVGSPM